MPLIPDWVIERNWRRALAGIACGRLDFTAPDGSLTSSTGPAPGPSASFRIADWDVIRRLVARGDIGLGEAYIAGAWQTDNIESLIVLLLLNLDVFEGYAHGTLMQRLGFFANNAFVRRNSLAGSARNIKAHYDVGNDFYALWLDRTMTYSAAVYGDAPTLEEAQRNKYGRILDKADASGHEILEIGCGWGGFAESAVEAGHAVTGLTISPAQHRFAVKRLGGRADIRLEDYRKSKGVFDMVVSIEMIEAVGEHYWPQYFAILAARLKRSGTAVIQAITIRDDLFAGYRKRSDFVRHYVFPGGTLIPLERLKQEAEKAGFALTEVFRFGGDYARTLREWAYRMQMRRTDIHALGYDDKFFRNWEFYFGICTAAFSAARTDVVQVAMVKR